MLVARAYFDLVEAIEDVEARDRHVVDAREHPRVADDDGVEPAGTARAPRDGAELMSRLTQFLSDGVQLLRGEGTLADARAVCLDDADDLVDLLRRDACADGDAARDGVRCGDVGVGAVVDVQHGRLCALEEDFAPGGDLLVDEGDGVGDERAQTLGVALVLLQHLVIVKGLMVVDGGELCVLIVKVFLELLGKLCAVHEVTDSDADAVVTVHVARADAASRCADFVRAALGVADAVHQSVVGHDDVRTVGDADVRCVDAARRHGVHLLQADLGVKGDAVRDDVVRALVEDARGQEAEFVLLAGRDDGVSCVAAALIADDGVCLAREVVDDFPFALVAPLGTGNNDG